MPTVTFESPVFEAVGGFSVEAASFTEKEKERIYNIFSRNLIDMERCGILFPRLSAMIERNLCCAHMHTSVGVLMDIQTVFDVYVKKEFAPKTYIYPCENSFENFFKDDCNIFRAVDYVVFFQAKEKLIEVLNSNLQEPRILIKQIKEAFDGND